MFNINNNYKNTKNSFNCENGEATMTVLNKKGAQLTTKIDEADIERIENEGIWFAEWNKDFNSYLVQNISFSKKNKKSKPLKQSLHSFIMGVSPNAPVRHLNNDTLDNRRCNLEIFKRDELNATESIDEDTTAIILLDKYGNENGRALISTEDITSVIIPGYTWVNHIVHGQSSVVANTPSGRIHLDSIIMNPSENQHVHHINLNPLDNRRCNLEIIDKKEEEEE